MPFHVSIGEKLRVVRYRIGQAFKRHRKATIVMVDRPRYLDDPLSDPFAQERVGEVISKYVGRHAPPRRKT